jgi:hypothetical protein
LPSVNSVTAEVASLLLNCFSITTQTLVLGSTSRSRKAKRGLIHGYGMRGVHEGLSSMVKASNDRAFAS